MKIKASEAEGAVLDWLVAKCEGTFGVAPLRCFDCEYHEEQAVQDGSEHYCNFPRVDGPHWYSDGSGDGDYFGEGIGAYHGVHRRCPMKTTAQPYSTDPSQSWPIIERERIATIPCGEHWNAAMDDQTLDVFPFEGPTPLIAAMRCYVASKLGDEVEVPEELL